MATTDRAEDEILKNKLADAEQKDNSESISDSKVAFREDNLSEDEMFVDTNMAYANLNRQLDRKTRMSVLDILSLDSLSDDDSTSSRQVSYDPQASAKFRGDPMNYGAYRRWKEAEMEIKEKASKKSKNKNEFFDSIKKLGSGPAPKGTPTGVGVADPKPNMKNITPKKAPGRKRPAGKKFITPDDINSLFKTGKTSQSVEEEEEETDEDPSSSASSSSSTSSAKKSFGFIVGPDEDMPDWIMEAEKQEKKRKAMRGKKRKKLTDDWRFWAACVGGVGFVSAFVNIYQQTGGFGSQTQELVL
eukprot:CAMPEP_0182427206 /NCGR_PEP_ID=MMETSP1167-20130531/15761_1 /TAXON_ID=2988 /ORGANISM="Mallomonas Sp, Strain CCMP3275" /LENGTH=301 /DNA_ID=CAMNT_0024609265 /DNA_START=348 /DNA_END=1253 /DNA_ORIENTATION=-